MKMNYCFRHFKVMTTNDYSVAIVTSDGYLVNLRRTDTLPINRRLWYDDETKCPENTFENFRSYNIGREAVAKDYGRLRLAARKSDPSVYMIAALETIPQSYSIVRALSQDEEADLKGFDTYMRTKYELRLKTYWKRYSSKVCWCGYWVNR